MIGILSNKRLGYQQPVERIAVVQREPSDFKEVSEFDREQRDAVDAQLFRNK